MDNKELKVGDKVWWRGNWGSATDQVATVLRIEVVHPGEKYGREIQSVLWDHVCEEIIVDLDNNHWARGSQLSPYTDD